MAKTCVLVFFILKNILPVIIIIFSCHSSFTRADLKRSTPLIFHKSSFLVRRRLLRLCKQLQNVFCGFGGSVPKIEQLTLVTSSVIYQTILSSHVYGSAILNTGVLFKVRLCTLNSPSFPKILLNQFLLRHQYQRTWQREWNAERLEQLTSSNMTFLYLKFLSHDGLNFPKLSLRLVKLQLVVFSM